MPFIEQTVEWGGQVLSRDPRRYRYSPDLLFEETESPRHINRLLGNLSFPGRHNENFRVVYLIGSNLSDLENTGNRENFQPEEHSLIKLIREMYRVLRTFCIVNYDDEDRIDERIICAEEDEAVGIFLDSLKWERSKGIVIVKP